MSDTPLEANSPMLLVLDHVANKWAVLAVSTICNQPKRFNQLRREIGGISQKMLSQTLKRLERDGIVARAVTATVPVTVEYSITELGKTLAATVNHLRIWSEQNIDQILIAQERYDRVEIGK